MLVLSIPLLRKPIQSIGAAGLAGDIALIRGGELHVIEADEPYQFSIGYQFGIVFDTYVKWRGGKIPSEEEEPKVCLGQSQRSHWSTADKCGHVYIYVLFSVCAMC